MSSSLTNQREKDQDSRHVSSNKPTKEIPPRESATPVATPAPPERGSASDQQTEIRRELGDFEKISVRIQRRMLFATWAIALITGVYVVVTSLQLLAMRGQLAEMHGTGIQTDKL